MGSNLSLKALQEQRQELEERLVKVNKNIAIAKKVEKQWNSLLDKVGLVFFYKFNWWETTSEITSCHNLVDRITCFNRLDKSQKLYLSPEDILKGLPANLIGSEFTQLFFTFRVVSINLNDDTAVCSATTPMGDSPELPDKVYPLKDVYHLIYG